MDSHRTNQGSKINWQAAAHQANSEVLRLNQEILEMKKHWSVRESSMEHALRVGDTRLQEMERRLTDEHHDLRQGIERYKLDLNSGEARQRSQQDQIQDLTRTIDHEKQQYRKLKEQKDSEMELMKRMKQRYSEMIDERARERSRLEETGELAEKYLKGQENIQHLSQLCSLLRHLTPRHYETVRFLLDEANGRTLDSTSDLVDSNAVGRDWEFVKLQVVENYRQLAMEMVDEAATLEEPQSARGGVRGGRGGRFAGGMSRSTSSKKMGNEAAILSELNLGISPDVAKLLAASGGKRENGYFTFRDMSGKAGPRSSAAQTPASVSSYAKANAPTPRPGSAALSPSGSALLNTGLNSARPLTAGALSSRSGGGLNSARRSTRAQEYLFGN